MPSLPSSIAIAGAWGYVGRKFLDASLALGIKTYVYDPGPTPDDVDLTRMVRVDSEQAFYRTPAELFHLALQPWHRRTGIGVLLERSRKERVVILNEKPMAPPDDPGECQRLIDAVHDSNALMLFDFPELLDRLTARIVDRLAKFRKVEINQMTLVRSKDREDPDNARNYKRMTPIQYQESVHCLAFMLYILTKAAGDMSDVLAPGVRLTARSETYNPPNPGEYPYVVDGKCDYRISLGHVQVQGLTNFKRHAPWSKRRTIRGIGDGQPFEIDVDFLEGHKRLSFDGQPQPCDPNEDSYQQAIQTAWYWRDTISQADLMQGLYPNPEFTRLTYQFSSALWKSCHDVRPMLISSVPQLKALDVGFAETVERMPRYPMPVSQ